MGDNVGYTPGTGKVIAADDVAGALHQRIKISLGDDGTAVDLDGTQTHGAWVNPRRLVKRVAGTYTNDVPGAYVSGDAIGKGVTFASAARANAGVGHIRSVSLIDLAKQNAAVDVLFVQEITSYVPTDNGVFAPSDANLTAMGVLGVVSFVGGDYQSYDVNSVATKQVLLPFICGAATTSIFAYLISRGTPTYAASDLTPVLGFEQL